jgi:deferrochelatase/peroxidase EfeB
MSSRLQEGIYYDVGARPPACFSIMFLKARSAATAEQVGKKLAELWTMYDALKTGRISDLPGVDLPTGDLSVLVGYGVKTFALTGVRRVVPDALLLAQFRSPSATGGTILSGSSLRYGPGLPRNPATEEVMIQAIANTSLAANRAIVETWKLLREDAHPDGPTLDLAAAFSGFNREDGRSWIDFHDGVSNLTSGQERLDALGIKPVGAGTDGWTVGGTYQGFLRTQVDLAAWRQLSVSQQEAAVGRQKITGCPLADFQAGGSVVDAGCPFTATHSILEPGNETFREPSNAIPDVVRKSHVQRANHHQGPVDRDASRRIFRQGYEFLEPPGPGRPLSVGLNFVSFQDTPDRLFFILKQPGWLGDANFGGDEALLPSGGLLLLSVQAAGVFLCPPVVEGEVFPGQGLFYDAESIA